jgi:divalent metal cation (Fe/Co/Zn/Cd) transporter
VLTTAALLLARETKGLLIGEAAHPHVRKDILRIAGLDPAIRCANGVFTVQLGPDSVFATLSAEFEDALTTPEVEACVNRIEAAVREAHPDVVALYVKPQTAGTWKRRIARLEDDETPLP